MKKLKVGIVGAGGVAQFGHIPAFQAIEGVEVTALSDPNKEKLSYATGKFCIPDGYTDYRKLLGREDIEVVSICTPNYLHAEISKEALRAGKHVLCEKPLTLNLREAESVIAEARRSGKLFCENLSQRYDLPMVITRRFARAGRLGHIYYAKCSYLRRKGHPGLGGWFTSRKESGGGALIDLGIHVLDLGLWLMDFPKPVTVLASTHDYFVTRAADGGWPPADTRVGDDFKKNVDTEDLATAYIRFEDGSALLVEAGWAGYSETGVNIKLFGSEGGAEILKTVGGCDEGRPLLFRIVAEVEGSIVDINPAVPETFSYWADTFPGFIRHFVRCVRGEEEPIETSQQLLTVQRLIDCIYLSAVENRAVML
jgi:predicted dehydrogenase